MHLLYVDESGDPNGWSNQRHFVLGAVAIHEGQIQRLTKEMDIIQKKYFPSIKIRVPLHAVDVHQGKGHFDTMPSTERKQLLLDISDLIGRQTFPKLVTFSTSIHISALKTKKEALEKAVEDLTSRFNIFMKRLYSKDLRGKGLLIIDQAHQVRYRELIAEFQSVGSKYGKMTNIVDIPYFAGAQDTRMLEIADVCAYSVFRFYERNDHDYFDRLYPSFDKTSLKSGPDGLKHFIDEECHCPACEWHNTERRT